MNENYQTCNGCKYFIEHDNPQMKMEAAKTGVTAGLCNALPPVPVVMGMQHGQGVMQSIYPPVTNQSRACGQYSPVLSS